MSRRNTLARGVVAVVLTLCGFTSVTAAAGTASPAPVDRPQTSATAVPASLVSAVARTGYVNPVSQPFADTFADPSVIHAKDGWWYAYSTSDPLRQGETTPHQIAIARSRDLVGWSFVGDAFSLSSRPSWAATDAGLWAPDIRYVNGQYRMYYVVTQTTVTPEPNDNAIGMATAPTPSGPWTDSGAPVVGPRRGASGTPGDFLWTFDPTVVTNRDGAQWLFYGSYYGGLFVTRLSGDGARAVGLPTRVAIDNKFEGAYVVQRGGYWYLFASTANCCAGPTTGYSVEVGRSPSLTGPYVDKEGVPLLASRAGGTPTLFQTGNRWIGAGHNAVATDLTGQDWILYHAVDRADPYLNGTDGIPRRPMLLDRLDWVAGWPVVRAGRGPSDGPQPGPATGGRFVTDFTSGITDHWSQLGRWTTASETQAGRYAAASSPGALLTVPDPALATAVSTDGVRAQADLRSSGAAYGLVSGDVRSPALGGVAVVVDPGSREVVVQGWRGGRSTGRARAPLPAGYTPGTWHQVSLTVRAGVATAQVSNAGLGDPLATVSLDVRGFPPPAQGGALATGAGVDVDNLSVVPAAVPVTRLAPVTVPRRLDPAASDEFNGGTLDPGWTWVRPDPRAVVSAGSLRWPTETADLVGTTNDAGVLLRDPGHGDWTAETKLTLDLGVDTVRNFQQGGLVAYVDDDLFTRLSHVAIWDTRQVEFGKEMPFAGRLSYGGTIIGPPAETTWLRLTHTVDPSTGEHELQGWSSTDGTTWIAGGVWTLPAGARLRVGLISMGGAGATATFDFFRLYRR